MGRIDGEQEVLRFTVNEIRHYYRNMELPAGPWRYNRKHYRFETLGHNWVKLNRLEDRINSAELQEHLVRYVPRHAYFSVLDYLRPQYVGSRKKTVNALPIGARARSLVDHAWDRAHFILSCDPLRVMTVPNTLNLETGLVCLHIGSPWVLENLGMRRLVEKASPLRKALEEPYPASMFYQMV